MKILLCFGTRPEAIKMAPLCVALKKTNFDVKICITAQHRKMLDQVLDFFEIHPDYDLDLMKENQTLNQLSSKIIFEIDKVLTKETPDLVIVHGDTTTSSMVALASFHKSIKVAHVEAGLRTYNKNAPFPEEINRQLTGKIADYHFAPTSWAAENLYKENISKDNVVVTGNTVIDALFLALQKIKDNESLINEDLQKIFLNNKNVILTTIHRRENFGAGFENICNALNTLALNNDVKIVIPVHLNPNVQEPVTRILGKNKNILLMEPLNYPNFVYALNNAKIIITDSGGVQEEAPSLGKPVLVVRDTTERPEAVEAGTVKLVGTDSEKIISEAQKLLLNKEYYNTFSSKSNPYGDGNSSEKIIDFLKRII
ncbi:MAG: UDP-N-acetylglucosamine 2-epimerase (non-hydrolyzing) [Flavobacterium sp.]|uniref:non-hydrolyzing UDP-N-acetylglucosamine 2-epimerase n=1 Tax=Flavobacterium sp. TaxID=239 RepID=UPI0022C5045B|nr:UDP-N-acetylglucosamine 2-epimerase (non-hydrolyzing) [Flavobacterium sp.]MCZ8197292.1 UDP-N-acetylglucosamine 2-epimerase (non-hydrolyzing) [Flavobacterium sp.]